MTCHASGRVSTEVDARAAYQRVSGGWTPGTARPTGALFAIPLQNGAAQSRFGLRVRDGKARHRMSRDPVPRPCTTPGISSPSAVGFPCNASGKLRRYERPISPRSLALQRRRGFGMRRRLGAPAHPSLPKSAKAPPCLRPPSLVERLLSPSSADTSRSLRGDGGARVASHEPQASNFPDARRSADAADICGAGWTVPRARPAISHRTQAGAQAEARRKLRTIARSVSATSSPEATRRLPASSPTSSP